MSRDRGDRGKEERKRGAGGPGRGDRGADRGLRLFVALPVDEAARREAARRVDELRPRLPPARWVPAENLHLTLAFLGDVARETVPRLVEATAPAFAACPGLTLRFAGGGTFPPRRPPRAAWIGVHVEEGTERLERLRAEVTAAAVRTVGHRPDDRPWSPHLTLARPKARWRQQDSETFAAAFEAPLAPAAPLAAGHLVESRLGRGPGGAPEYRSLAAFPLGGAAARTAGGGREAAPT